MHAVTHNEKGHRNNYCGPAAISALAGITAEEAAAVLRHVSDSRAIRGVFSHHATAALRKLGLEATPIVNVEGKPLSKARLGSGKVFVFVTGHFVAVEGRRLWDNSNNDGTDRKAYGRRKVISAWKITGRTNRDIIRKLSKVASDRKAAAESARISAKQAAKKAGIIITDDGDRIGISAPEGKVLAASGCSFYYWYRCDYDTSSELWGYVRDCIECGLDDDPHG